MHRLNLKLKATLVLCCQIPHRHVKHLLMYCFIDISSHTLGSRGNFYLYIVHQRSEGVLIITMLLTWLIFILETYFLLKTIIFRHVLKIIAIKTHLLFLRKMYSEFETFRFVFMDQPFLCFDSTFSISIALACSPFLNTGVLHMSPPGSILCYLSPLNCWFVPSVVVFYFFFSNTVSSATSMRPICHLCTWLCSRYSSILVC